MQLNNIALGSVKPPIATSPPDFHASRRAILDQLPVSDVHRKLLRASGLSDEAIDARYHSIDLPIQLQLLGLPAVACPALVIEETPIGGGPPLLTVRSDKPADPKRKYLTERGQPMRVTASPQVVKAIHARTVRKVFITEGAKKADAGWSHGLSTVSLAGVESYGRHATPGLPIYEDWQALRLNGLDVVVAFDSDAQRNPNVQRARFGLTDFLRARGAKVEWLILSDAEDGSKQGLDDFLAAGHTVDELLALVQPPADNPLITAPMTDAGNAERFEYFHNGRLMYVPGIGWVEWDGTRYRPTPSPRGAAIATMRAAQTAAVNLDRADTRREFLRQHGERSEHLQRLNAMITIAQEFMMADVEEFDRHLFLLNVANGTLDLKSGVLKPHDPADLITKLSPIIHDPEATCPLFEALLAYAFYDDEAMLAYFQQLCGIFLTGDVSEKIYPIIWGPSNTGKTTVVDMLMYVLGDAYAQVVSEATMDASGRKRSGSEASPDLARLVGVRLAVLSETSRTMQLNVARVKSMTGRNKQTARQLHQEQFDYTPQFKLLVETNDRPGMRDGDDAIFNRVHLIPFTRVVPKELQDKDLPEKLKEEASGILAWMVRGCMAWQQAGGLVVPDQVLAATEEYKRESDPLTEFIDDACATGPGFSTATVELFREYGWWCRNNEERHPLGKHQFNKRIAERGIERVGRNWIGIKVRGTQGNGMDRMTS